LISHHTALLFHATKTAERVIGSTLLWQQADAKTASEPSWQRLRLTPLLLLQTHRRACGVLVPDTSGHLF